MPSFSEARRAGLTNCLPAEMNEVNVGGSYTPMLNFINKLYITCHLLAKQGGRV